MLYKSNCNLCKKPFTRILTPSNIKAGKGKFCSKMCGTKGRKKVEPWNKGKKMSVEYCNRISLSQKGLKRKPLSKETKQKIADANRKRFYSIICPDCGKTLLYSNGDTRCKKCADNKRRKPRPRCIDCSKIITQKSKRCRPCSYLDEEKRIKLSNRLKELHLRPTNAFLSGDKHPMWKGGVIPAIQKYRASTEYKFIRIQVFKRDNYKCVLCYDHIYKNNRIIIQLDHIIPVHYFFTKYKIKSYKQVKQCKELWDTKNMRTLCQKCHKKTETYGNKVKMYTEKLLENKN